VIGTLPKAAIAYGKDTFRRSMVLGLKAFLNDFPRVRGQVLDHGAIYKRTRK
jgi:hypothetical protein